MARAKITKRTVDSIDATDGKRVYVFDTDLSGFGLMVTPNGSKSYFAEYRHGSGRGAPTRRVTIGTVSKLTPDEARNLAKQTIADATKGQDPASRKREQRESLSVRALAETFMKKHVNAKRKANTSALYQHVIDTIIVPHIGTKRATTVTKGEIARMHLDLSERPFLANRALAVVGSMYSWAGKHGFVEEGFNPVVRVEKYAERKRERFLTTAELEKLGATLREGETTGIPWQIDTTKPTAKHAPREENRRITLGPHVAAAFRLLLLTGARLREILHLEWAHVDLERGILLLPDSKTGKKTIVLNGPAMLLLSELPRIGKYVIASESAGQKEEKPRADLKRPWAAVSKRAGLDGVRIHDLRHTHASFGIGASFGLPIIGKLLGHTQMRTTERYAHLQTDPLRRASNAIGNALATAMGEKASEDNILEINAVKRKAQ
ncbi:MAG: site-specific integrase [Alphaproteobacteria bacterium]|nr:site-specific integrase [Alphaproteobacteria bacterium]